ncbi:MAG: flagellar hook-length control protein FliK [Fibrobacterota bacterium]
MEVNLNLLSVLSAAARQAGVDLPLDTPVKATLVEVKGDGSLVLDVNGARITVAAGKGADALLALARSGDGLSLVFSRDASGRLKVQLFTGATAQAGTDSVEMQAASKLARAFEDFTRILDEIKVTNSRALSPKAQEQLLSLKQEFAILIRAISEQSLLQAFSPERPIPQQAPLTLPAGVAAPQPFPAGSASPANVLPQDLAAAPPAPAAPVSMTAPVKIPDPIALARTAAALIKGDALPAMLRQAVAALVRGLNDMHLPVPQAKNTVLLPLAGPAEKSMPRLAAQAGVLLSVQVEEMKPNGRALLRLPSGESVEVLPPMPLKKGEPLTVTYAPALKAFTMTVNAEPRVSPAIIAEVRAAAEEEGVLAPLPVGRNAAPSTAPSPLPPGLQSLAEKVQRFSDKFALPLDESRALARSLVFLQKNEVRADTVRPELALYRNLQSVGEGITEILRLATALEKELPEGQKAWVRELQRLLQPFTEKPLLEHEPSARRAQVRKIFEESGVFFESRLLKLANDKDGLQRLAQTDTKALLQRLMDFTARNPELPAELKGRLQQESFRLFQTVEAVQVRTLADADTQHLLIPLVNSGEEKSAYVTFKRRGRRKPIDGRNTSVTVRVSPSALGEVMGRADIREGVLRVDFFVENEALAELFRDHSQELLDRLLALGYKVSGVRALPVRTPYADQEAMDIVPDTSTRNSFDVTI